MTHPEAVAKLKEIVNAAKTGAADLTFTDENQNAGHTTLLLVSFQGNGQGIRVLDLLAGLGRVAAVKEVTLRSNPERDLNIEGKIDDRSYRLAVNLY